MARDKVTHQIEIDVHGVDVDVTVDIDLDYLFSDMSKENKEYMADLLIDDGIIEPKEE